MEAVLASLAHMSGWITGERVRPRQVRFALAVEKRRKALRAALSAKLQGGDVIVVDALSANDIDIAMTTAPTRVPTLTRIHQPPRTTVRQPQPRTM